MHLYLDRKEEFYLIFYSDTNEKYDIKLGETNIQKNYILGAIYDTVDFKNFCYNEKLTCEKRNSIVELQRKLFEN